MSHRVHDPPQIREPAGHTGRRLVVHDDDGLEGMPCVVAEQLLEIDIGRAAAPVSRHIGDIETQPLRHLTPDLREMSGLEDEHAIARRQRVDERRFGGAGAGRRKDDDRTAGSKHHTQRFQELRRQRGELRPAMIDDRTVHGTQDPIGNVGRAWNLEKMTTGVKHDTDEFTASGTP
jgi:hypothetical protein